MRSTHANLSRSSGFTLIEILVVVVLLGILAALVIPQFTNASAQSRDNSMRMSLYRLRGQLEVYKQEHNGNWPTLANFENQMTLASNVDGATAAVGTAGYPLGPYVREIPVNPFTDTRDISAGSVGSSAWYYNETTGQFSPNDTADHRLY
jgi:type II secretion system protein G